MNNTDIRYVRGKDGLLSIKDEWNTLTQTLQSKHYFHTYEFHLSYINSLEEDDSCVHFFLFAEADQPFAIIPLVLRETKVFGIPINVLRTYPDTYRFEGIADFVIGQTNRPLLNLLLSYLKRSRISWHVMHAAACLEDSHIIDLVRKEPSINSMTESTGLSDYLTKEQLVNIHQEIIQNRRKTRNRRKTSNIQLKKLRQIGDVNFRHSNDGHALRQYFDEFLSIESSGWKGTSGTSIDSNPKYAEFFYQLIYNFSQTDSCEISFLDLNDQPIAGYFSITTNNTYYVPKTAFDERYSKMSPGIILLEQLMSRVSEDDNVQEFNLISHTDWMARWEPHTREKYRVLVFNSSLHGLLVSFGYRMLNKLKGLSTRFYLTIPDSFLFAT